MPFLILSYPMSSAASPMPPLLQRPACPQTHQAALTLGLSPLQASLVARRLSQQTDVSRWVFPRLKDLPPINQLHQAEQAASLLADAIMGDQLIVVCTDYDADGLSAASLITEVLRTLFHLPRQRLLPIIGQRQSGYGITDALVDEILARHQHTPISLVLTADQGSSDEARLARLRTAGIATLVTDHHQLPVEGAPASASCFVNPQQPGCQYDPNIAGATVAFLVLAATRSRLIERGYLPADTPSLKAQTAQVALATIADCMNLSSPTNRALVHSGLSELNQSNHPSWQSLRALQPGLPIDAEFLAFQAATRINAASRMGTPLLALDFLTADSPESAQQHLKALDAANRKRRQKQQDNLQQAQNQVHALLTDFSHTLTLSLPDAEGVQGIIAQRMGELHQRPTVVFSPVDGQLLAGSLRTIDPAVDGRAALQQVADQHPQLFVSMGGHKAAGGCKIPAQRLQDFRQAFEQAVAQQRQQPTCLPLWYDEDLSEHPIDLSLWQQQQQLQPYGEGWPAPRYVGQFLLMQAAPMGANSAHWKLRLRQGQRLLDAVWFNAPASTASQLQPGQACRLLFRLSMDSFMGRTGLRLYVEQLLP